MVLILAIIAAALLNIVSTLKKRDRGKIIKAFVIVSLILVIAGMPFFIQIALVGERANRAKSTYISDEIGMNNEFYDYLSSSHFDIKKYLPPGCQLFTNDLRLPPEIDTNRGIALGTPYASRDPKKALFIKYGMICNGDYDKAINYFSNILTRTEGPIDEFYGTLSTSPGVEEVAFVVGDSQDIDFWRVLFAGN